MVEDYPSERTREIQTPRIPVAKIPWIPIVGPQLKKALRKHGCKVVFTAGKKS